MEKNLKLLMRTENLFIGEDGRYYYTPEALDNANRQWNNTHLTYICPRCHQHIQAGVYDSHLKSCVDKFNSRILRDYTLEYN